MSDFINVQNLTFKYNEEENIIGENVIDNVTFNVKQGEFLALLGHNGCGKSTIAKQLNAMLLPSGGSVTVMGMDTKDENLLYEIRRCVGLVLQNPDNQLVATIVEEDVAFGPENLGIVPEEIRQRVDEALKSVDMYEYRKHSTHKLSGGQKQRIAIAGIIAMKPKCIVLDEPTAMLDPKGRKEVMSTIKKLNKENGITVILITHYMDEAAQSDRIIVMDSGKILLEGTPREVFSNVDLLRKYELDVPQSTELAFNLKKLGLKINTIPITIDECTQMLENLFSK